MSETVITPDIYNPDGIDARGMGTVVLIPAVAGDVPTTAEINAGIIISCALYNFGTTREQGMNSYAKYCDTDNRQSAGRTTWGVTPLIVDDDPQRVDTSGQYDYLDQIVEGQRYWLWDVRGIKAKEYTPTVGERGDLHPIRIEGWRRLDIDPTAEADKLRREYTVTHLGDPNMDVEVTA